MSTGASHSNGGEVGASYTMTPMNDPLVVCDNYDIANLSSEDTTDDEDEPRKVIYCCVCVFFFVVVFLYAYMAL